MGQKHSYNLNRAKVTRQSTQIIQDEIASTAEPTHPSEPVPLGVRTSLDGSDYVRREMERQEQQEKLAKCQENGTSGQGKGQEVPPLENQASAVEGSQTVAEPVEEEVPKCNVVVLKCQENAMESQTGEEEVPQCQENAMENQSEPVAEPFADAIPSPQANVHEVEAVPEFANDALKSEESAIDVQETGKAEVEAVQDVPTINQLVEECVAGTKDVLLEVQAVGLLIHENEEHAAQGQTDEGEVPKSGGEENGKSKQMGEAANEEGRESIDQVLEGKMGASADVPEEEIVISQCHISDQSDSRKEGLITTQEELISQGEPTSLANAGPPISQESDEDGLIEEQQQQVTLISEEGLISEEKQQTVTEATTDEEALVISIQLNELTISPAKELDADGGKDDVVQLQKLVANGIASGEVGQIVADVVQNVVQTDAAATPAIQHGHQQQPQAVVELAVDEPPSNGRPEHEAEKTPMTTSTTTTVLVVNNDENDADAQLATPLLNTNDVNIVEVNSRKPSNV
ncbi:hypothetical protein niasHT_028710 [Heterodera trifolii]|uniref:Uncharacterized protein n=1 Tax=Heterodera trifolii TaxID=157864 RepID=A0ABD2JIU5_9BILA